MKLRSPITLLFLFFIAESHAIWLTIPTSGTKCVSEDIQSNVVVLADYYVVADEVDHHQIHTVSLKVTSPYGNNLHQKENVTHGQFAFTSAESGTYLACFWLQNNHQQPTVTVSLDWRTGISAKDWETVAKKEKIQGVELELRKLEAAVEAIRENLIYLKNREADMREVSESTNAKVAWFSIMSLGLCIIVAALQLWYLKRYFRKKKLI
ncbi:hypothetical protein HN51_052650 [Arachis hypogaea]|uniref:transmembrane emp24 domain-containing protein p24delta3 n=1 Tax=Arachis ipaensis TaxID=130454 RepID=UPI0007AF242D|nr:transmembrane emp24 domain-containing protein p24delta3 [Arachis ipaensis]XP_025666305.1 transmembrane emp24 domain-containing protein p24delta3 [Arachis hypogaea]QHN94037.1 Transmembrane emp24 domain-containing protein [Arachis hypogaea]